MESKNNRILCISAIIVIVMSVSIPSYLFLNYNAGDKNYGPQDDEPIKISAYTPSGLYQLTPGIFYTCASGFVNLAYTQFTFVDNGVTLTVQPAMNGDCYMTGDSPSSDGVIDVSCTTPGGCNQEYSLVGTFSDNNTWNAVFSAKYSGSQCWDCINQAWSITGTRIDITDPVITDTPGNFTVELGYSDVNISWTATDANPDLYTIELEGSGTVAGPASWSSGVEIRYNVPDGLGLGEYLYTVNFTDDSDNFIKDTVKMTVIEDTSVPIIISSPSNFTVDYGYTGVYISWTATDANPDLYTIELEGSGIVAGPTTWSSGIAITYYVPDGLTIDEYLYKVNFTDDYGNFVTDTMKMSVLETDKPIITSFPSNFTVDYGYTGVNISWTATDVNPNLYTIELEGSEIVAGPLAWLSGIEITYNVPDGLAIGEYLYIVNFTDVYGNYVTDTVKMIVRGVSTDGNGFGIPFGNYYLVFLIFGIILLTIVQNRKRL